MQGMGIRAARGIRNTRVTRTTTACTIPATGEFPPFLMLAAVRAMAPVAGIPPNRAEAVLPMPWATSSMLELCRPPIISSATTQDSRDSMAARIAMVNASGRTAATVS